MVVSTRSLQWLSVLLVVMLGTVSCSQAGALDTGARISPTAPSSVGLGAADIKLVRVS
jgi:hypothetical protein